MVQKRVIPEDRWLSIRTVVPPLLVLSRGVLGALGSRCQEFIPISPILLTGYSKTFASQFHHQKHKLHRITFAQDKSKKLFRPMFKTIIPFIISVVLIILFLFIFHYLRSRRQLTDRIPWHTVNSSITCEMIKCIPFPMNLNLSSLWGCLFTAAQSCLLFPCSLLPKPRVFSKQILPHVHPYNLDVYWKVLCAWVHKKENRSQNYIPCFECCRMANE